MLKQELMNSESTEMSDIIRDISIYKFKHSVSKCTQSKIVPEEKNQYLVLKAKYETAEVIQYIHSQCEKVIQVSS